MPTLPIPAGDTRFGNFHSFISRTIFKILQKPPIS